MIIRIRCDHAGHDRRERPVTIVELEHDHTHGWRELVVQGRATVLTADAYSDSDREVVRQTPGPAGYLSGDGRWWSIGLRCRRCGAGPRHTVRFAKLAHALDSLAAGEQFPLDDMPLAAVHRALDHVR